MAFLETGISVIFAFLIISIFVSAINEIIAFFLNLRAKELEAGIEKLIGPGMKDSLFGHPVLRFMRKKGKAGPSYIKSQTFSQTLIDILAAQGNERKQGWLHKGALDLRKSIDAVELPQECKELLSSFAGELKDDLSAFRQKVESWYDTAMESVSAWYAAKMRILSLGVALFIAIAANVDPLVICSQLSSDKEARKLVVEQAIDYMETGQEQSTEGVDRERIERIINQELAGLEKSGIIGWGEETRIFMLEDPGQGKDSSLLITIVNILLKMIGFLLCAAASSLGASFWFDLLSKFVNLRTVLKPEGKK